MRTVLRWQKRCIPRSSKGTVNISTRTSYPEHSTKPSESCDPGSSIPVYGRPTFTWAFESLRSYIIISEVAIIAVYFCICILYVVVAVSSSLDRMRNHERRVERLNLNAWQALNMSLRYPVHSPVMYHPRLAMAAGPGWVVAC